MSSKIHFPSLKCLALMESMESMESYCQLHGITRNPTYSLGRYIHGYHINHFIQRKSKKEKMKVQTDAKQTQYNAMHLELRK